MECDRVDDGRSKPRPYNGFSSERVGLHVECEGKFYCEEFR